MQSFDEQEELKSYGLHVEADTNSSYKEKNLEYEAIQLKNLIVDDGEEVKTSQLTEDNNNRLVQSERVKTSKSESYLNYLHNRISMRMIG